MSYDGSIRIDTSIDTSGFNDGISKVSGTASEKLDKVSASADKVGSSTSTAGSKFSSAGEKMSKTGAKMTLGLTTPLVALGRQAVKAGADFEDTMSQTAGALNIPMSQMGGMRDLALKMGADTQFSAKEAGEAMVELAKGGLTEAQIKGGALKATMDLAASSGMELGTSANVVVQAMGAFGLSADKSSVAANALAGAAAASSTDVEPLTQGLAQCGAQAHLAGWNIQDTTAVLGAFADAGVNGADAGTSLKTMLQRLSAPTGAAAKLMKAYGINVRNSNGTMKSASEVAQLLHDKLGKLSPAARDAAMQTIFGSDASRAAAIMMNNGAAGLAKYTKATYDQTSAARLAASQQGNTNKALEQMKGSLETAGIALSTILNPIVRDVANKIQDLTNKFAALPAPVQKVVLAIAGIVAAAGPAIVGFGKLASGIGAIQKLLGGLGAGAKVVKDVSSSVSTLSKTGSGVGKVFKGLGSVFKTVGLGIGSAVKVLGSGLKVVGSGILSGIKGIGTAVKSLFLLLAANPAVLIIAAIAAIVLALIYAYNHCKAFRDGVNAVFGAIGNFFKTIGTGIANFFTKTVPQLFGNFVTFLKQHILDILSVLFPVLALPLQIIKHWNVIGPALQKFGAGVAKNVSGIVTGVGKAFGQVPGLLGSVWKNVSSAASTAWGSISNAITSWARRSKDNAVTNYRALHAGVSAIWHTVSGAASNIWGSISATISGRANQARSLAVSAFGACRSAVTGTLNGLRGAVGSIWSGITGTVSGAANRARGLAVGAFGAMRNGIHSVVGGIGSVISGGFGGAINFLSNLPGRMWHWGTEAISHLVDGIRAMIGNVQRAASDVADAIRSFLHFSIPDRGPLRDIMDWPRDMMQQYGGGMRSNKRYVTQAAADVAGSISLVPSQTAVRDMVGRMYAVVGAESAQTTRQYSASAAANAAQSSPRISTTIQPAPVTVQTDDRPIVMDGKTVGRVLAPHINKEFGLNDIKVKRGG